MVGYLFNLYSFSISAYISHHKLQNVKQPICVDITTPVDQWKDGQFDPNSYNLIYNANMIHISPWATAIVSIFIYILFNTIYHTVVYEFIKYD